MNHPNLLKARWLAPARSLSVNGDQVPLAAVEKESLTHSSVTRRRKFCPILPRARKFPSNFVLTGQFLWTIDAFGGFYSRFEVRRRAGALCCLLRSGLVLYRAKLFIVLAVLKSYRRGNRSCHHSGRDRLPDHHPLCRLQQSC